MSDCSVPDPAGLARHAVLVSSFCCPVKVLAALYFISSLRFWLAFRDSMTAQPSMASSVMPVSSLSLLLAAPLRVAWSRSKAFGMLWYVLQRVSSLSLAGSSVVAASTVPPTSAAS